MAVKFVAQSSMTLQEMGIWRDYFANAFQSFKSHADCEGYICRRYGITRWQLAIILGKVRVFDDQVRCGHCGVMYQVLNLVNYQSKPMDNWVCRSCRDFQQGTQLAAWEDDSVPF